jgi:hypothetical protein
MLGNREEGREEKRNQIDWKENKECEEGRSEVDCGL